jgi:hypothetical protein
MKWDESGVLDKMKWRLQKSPEFGVLNKWNVHNEVFQEMRYNL